MQTQFAETPKLAMLRHLMGPATDEASIAMCRWTNGQITLTLDTVSEIPLEEACVAMELGDDELTMVVLDISGDLGGTMILVFDEENARQLAASLLAPLGATNTPRDALEQSALTETGNILGCAYVSAISHLIGHDLVPSAPYFVRDFGASVLQQALVAQASYDTQALVCRTRFFRQQQELSWNVLFVPSQMMRDAMENAWMTASDSADETGLRGAATPRESHLKSKPTAS